MSIRVLVTGAAGFIGYHVCQRLSGMPDTLVLGVDAMGNGPSEQLRADRLRLLQELNNFQFLRIDLADPVATRNVFEGFRPTFVIHLAAQAGVRDSLNNPAPYVTNNLVAFCNVLEGARAHRPNHLLFASSSSVYGADAIVPFSEDQAAGHPVSFYGATKRANELFAHSYANLHRVPLTAVRFFSVYGPWGRPDMTPILFARAIFEGKTIKLYNHGRYQRDFTYVDDIVDGVAKLLRAIPSESAPIPYQVFNLGHHQPIPMSDFVRALEAAIGKKAIVELCPGQPTEMEATCADLAAVKAAIDYKPNVELTEGLSRFVCWFRRYYNL